MREVCCRYVSTSRSTCAFGMCCLDAEIDPLHSLSKQQVRWGHMHMHHHFLVATCFQLRAFSLVSGDAGKLCCWIANTRRCAPTGGFFFCPCRSCLVIIQLMNIMFCNIAAAAAVLHLSLKLSTVWQLPNMSQVLQLWVAVLAVVSEESCPP